MSSSEEAEGWSSLRADNFTTTLFSGTSGDLSEKTWWLFCMRTIVPLLVLSRVDR